MSIPFNIPAIGNYHSIPNNFVSEDEQNLASSPQRSHLFVPSAVSSRRFLFTNVRTVACVALCALVAFAGFTAVRHRRLRPSFKSVAASPQIYRNHFGRFNRQSSADNWEKVFSVPTGDCDYGLQCRALVVVQMKDGEATFSAGYRIFANVPKKVPASTLQRVAAVSSAEATTWAQELLKLMKTDLPDIEYNIPASDIATAILQGSQQAKNCLHTDEALCDSRQTVASVKAESACTKFYFSEDISNPTTSEELLSKAASCDLHYYYNGFVGEAPLCVTQCADGSQRKVSAEFGVQWNGGSTEAQGYGDCLAAEYRPLYTYYAGSNLPSCKTLTPLASGQEVLYPLYIVYDRQSYKDVPENIANKLQQCAGSDIAYVVFRQTTPMSEAIVAACA